MLHPQSLIQTTDGATQADLDHLAAREVVMTVGKASRAARLRYLDMSGSSAHASHRHGHRVHEHPYARPHRHLRLIRRSRPVEPEEHQHEDGHDSEHVHDHEHGHVHDHDHHGGEHGHSHGLVDPSIVRSRAGVKAVSTSLAVLVIASVLQVVVFIASRSVALLADLIHNLGDASTAIPLGIAFFMRSFRGEKIAGLFVVATIFVSACVAFYETIQRFIHPQELSHLWALAAAGIIGFVGNEIAAVIRHRAGRRLASPALVADGNHARVDGFVSLGVVVSAAVVGLGYPRADPLVGMAITLVILKITWDSWWTIRNTEPGELIAQPREH